jgi:hypothetical protein
MGKRELVLIAAFIVVGIVVYQVTAPPAPAGSDLSFGGIFQRMRRGMQGPRETAAGESHRAVTVDASVQTLRINLPRPCDLTITASERDDIAIDVKTTAHGYTPAEAKAAADGAAVNPQSQADALTLTGAWDDRRGPAGFVTQVTVALAIPKRLHVNLMPHIGLLTIKGVASLEAVSSRGETHVLDTAGDVQLTHVGGTLEVAGGTTLKLSTRNGRGDISGFIGVVSLELTGSRVKLSGITGPLDIEARNTDLTIEKIDALKPPMRFDGNGGELRVDGLRTEANIEGRNTDIDVRLLAAAPVTIRNNGGAILVTAPPGGYTLDAVASDGRITSEDESITATPENGNDARASAKVRGGGPTLSLRATRGRIELRRPAANAVK